MKTDDPALVGTHIFERAGRGFDPRQRISAPRAPLRRPTRDRTMNRLADGLLVSSLTMLSFPTLSLALKQLAGLPPIVSFPGGVFLASLFVLSARVLWKKNLK